MQIQTDRALSGWGDVATRQQLEASDVATRQQLEILRSDLRAEIADVRTGIARSERRLTQWCVGTMIAMTGIFSLMTRLG